MEHLMLVRKVIVKYRKRNSHIEVKVGSLKTKILNYIKTPQLHSLTTAKSNM